MSSIEALGNLDIWTEILQYFRIYSERDSDSEVKEKRKCLLRIALLSPSLTSLALDLLWRDMASLVPLTQVVNVNSEPILHFLGDQGGYWVRLDYCYWSYKLRTDPQISGTDIGRTYHLRQRS
jgi:hypothetical protein